MTVWQRFVTAGLLLTLICGYQSVEAQQNLAQETYAIFEQSCLGCHGPFGSFSEQLIIEHTALIENGDVIPGNPGKSELYRRLLGPTEGGAQMPLNQPALTSEAIETVRRWIEAGAPNWDRQQEVNFITLETMLAAIEDHVRSLPAFDRSSARYFTLTHLYNAGESSEVLDAYQIALSKLINSLSWGFDVINPTPIDTQQTIFYIDLRSYEWDARNDAWAQIEREYPYLIDFDPETQAGLREKMTYLRQELECDIPFVYVDWFLAAASLPPLYHDILDLPETERELERELGIDVIKNLQTRPGVHVWRAGLNDSRVSRHNRVLERHTFRDGAYWKSHDFAGSIGEQDIFAHPISFERDGGEIIFNLPNGLQAYYISDAAGNRINEAPINIVSNPAASDPVVRTGLSCIGCHAEGMQTFEDEVRAVILNTPDSLTKAQALRLYVEQSVMDDLVNKDKQRYREALEATGGVVGGIEPVHRFYEVFQGPIDAAHAAPAVGLEIEAFLQQIREKQSLRNLGIAGLLEGGNVKREVWTSNFLQIVSALNSPDDTVTPPDVPVTDLRPTDLIAISDPNLRSAIENALGKTAGALITVAEMAELKRIVADDAEISDLTGLEIATRLEHIDFRRNAISDLSPLSGLINLRWLGLEDNEITDLSPLKDLVRLKRIGISGNSVTDVSPLANLISLERIDAWRTPITDFSPLAKLPVLFWIEWGSDKSIDELPSLKGLKALDGLVISNTSISDLSGLVELTQLKALTLANNAISDVSLLAKLVGLKELGLENNDIVDVSPLSELNRLTRLNLNANDVLDVAPLAKLVGLQDLQLESNIISDVSPLAGLTDLKRLNLRNNIITNFSPLEGLEERTTINWQGNPGTLVRANTKIEGPWLWMIVPTDGKSGPNAVTSGIDFLAQMSNGAVTEAKIATDGATEGISVGAKVWTSGKISPIGRNNINDLMNAIGLGIGDINHHVAYGSIRLDSPREQRTTMRVGNDDAIKVWLNGRLVHNKPSSRGADDYQEEFPITLKEGINVLLVAVYEGTGGWSGFFGFDADTEYTLLPPRKGFSFATETTHFEVGGTFILHLHTTDVSDVAGWQCDIAFDPAVLKADSVREGSFLKQGGGRTYFWKGTIDNEIGRIASLSAARISEGGVSGEGRLLSVTFTAKAPGESRVALRRFEVGSHTGDIIPSIPPEIVIVVAGDASATPAWDVNADGTTNILDLVFVAGELGAVSPDPRADVNGDGTVNILDLVAVAGKLGESTTSAAPATTTIDDLTLDPTMIQAWLVQAEIENDGSPIFQRGIANLQRLLASLLPDKTTLLANYPNPFNPETWIPYHLAEAADVRVHIYATDGTLVRVLALGYQAADIYENRARAAYWDGKNEVGEPVASGLYFYRLTAGDFTATRKMLIKK